MKEGRRYNERQLNDDQHAAQDSCGVYTKRSQGLVVWTQHGLCYYYRRTLDKRVD